MLKNKNIIIGVTGGIAAYKAAILIRLLIKEGANVRVLMTEFAKHFVNPLTYSTLSKFPVLTEFYNPENGDWNSHVDLGLWADAFIIAPATANTIGKAANGIADNLLLTTYLSAKCPVFWAPAMDLDMFKHPAVQFNISKLKGYGNQIIDPDSGELASGLEGKGRMAEPEKIVDFLKKKTFPKTNLIKKKVLITAGPTYENIDPVRYIGNRSTGKMGYAIAECIASQGAEVTLISGPVNISTDLPQIKIISVTTAEEMYTESVKLFKNTDIAILSAAVSDYTPKNQSASKLKKEKEDICISLKPTKDIAKELGNQKKENQTVIGFALETDNELNNAIKKRERKNLDFIVLNSLKEKGAGFEYDTNKITIIDKNNNIEKYELKSKKDVAIDITKKIIELISNPK